MLYFAYGSNMNVSATQFRCPGITAVGASHLKGFRLVFKHHADIIPDDRCIVHGGLWKITERHEDALDTYESYPDYYDKYYEDDIMFYRMRADEEREPTLPYRSYLKTVVQGYLDFGLTQAEFEESLGVQQLGLTQNDLKTYLGISTEELARLFSGVTTPAVP